MIDVFYDEQTSSYTDGFEVKQNGLDIVIGQGTMHYINDEPVSKPIYDLEGHQSGLEQSDEKRIETLNYPELSFTVVPHDSLPVQYDVYLLELDGEPAYHLDRTLLSGLVQASYEGEGKPLHKLLTLIVPATAESLDHVPIHLNLVKLKNSENPSL